MSKSALIVAIAGRPRKGSFNWAAPGGVDTFALGACQIRLRFDRGKGALWKEIVVDGAVRISRVAA